MRRGPGRATDAQGWVPPTAGLGLKARMTGSARTNGNAEQASSAPRTAARRALFTVFAVRSAVSQRKSHSKSQCGQMSGDTQLRQATVKPGQVPSEPRRATSGDAREVTGGQGGRRFKSGRPDW